MAELTEKFVQNGNVIVTEVEGELLLLHGETFKCFSTNVIGTAVWHQLKQPRTADEVTAQLRQSYPEAPPSAGEEVSFYVEHLKKEGLIVGTV